MNLPDSLISHTATMIGWGTLIVALSVAARLAPWHAVRRVPLRINLILACTVSLALLWLLRADAVPGLSLHFLGLTAVTLLIGWQFALLAGTFALMGLTVLGHASWAGLGFDFWGTVAPPVAVTALISLGAQRLLPANFFIYLFVDVFLSALLSILAVAVTSSVVMWSLDLYDWGTLWHSYLALSPLQAIPEGILNGMVMAALTLLVPTWVISFDERRYFIG